MSSASVLVDQTDCPRRSPSRVPDGILRPSIPPATVIVRRSSAPDDFTRSVRALAGHDGDVVAEAELRAAVDAAFVVTARELRWWPDPHPDRSPREGGVLRDCLIRESGIVGPRADTWLIALVECGLAVVEANASVSWRGKLGSVISRTDRIAPLVAGALPLTFARSWLGDVDDARLILGLGDPAGLHRPVPRLRLRRLRQRFAERARPLRRAHGCDRVRCVSTPVRRQSDDHRLRRA